MVNSLTAIGSRRLTGLMIVVGLMLGGALAQASIASAAVSWDLNASPLTSATSVTAKGTLKFSDKKGGVFGEEIMVECSVTSEGSVGAGGAGEVTHVTATGCALKRGTCLTPTVTALNLPWHSELVAGVRDKFSSGGSGAPGFETNCPKGEGSYTCTGNTSAAVENVSGGVDTTFDANSEKSSCSRGGAGMGAIEGTELIANPAGGTLTAFDPKAEGWHLNGVWMPVARQVNSSGTLRFADHDSGAFGETVEIECTVSGEEKVGPEVAGEVTHLTPTECHTKAGSCVTPSIKAEHLPWQTELVLSGGVKRDLITSSSGPEYEVSCTGYSYTCPWNAGATMSNLSSEVEATYANEERQKCTHGSYSSITGTERIGLEGNNVAVG